MFPGYFDTGDTTNKNAYINNKIRNQASHIG